MKDIVRSSQFKKDWKKLKHTLTAANRGKFIEIVSFLQEEKQLPEKYLDHSLEGNYKNHRDCHIAPDLVLIYRLRESSNDVQLVRIGSHAALF